MFRKSPRIWSSQKSDNLAAYCIQLQCYVIQLMWCRWCNVVWWCDVLVEKFRYLVDPWLYRPACHWAYHYSVDLLICSVWIWLLSSVHNCTVSWLGSLLLSTVWEGTVRRHISLFSHKHNFSTSWTVKCTSVFDHSWFLSVSHHCKSKTTVSWVKTKNVRNRIIWTWLWCDYAERSLWMC